MIGGKQILGIIPARAGSKRIPGKNVRDLGGRPLLAWTVEAAKASKLLDRVIVSSECSEILAVAERYGAEPFVRPPELSHDASPGIAPVLHALQELPEFEYACLLQPTSPLRSAQDIDDCIEFCVRLRAPASISVTCPEKNIEWLYSVDGDYRMERLFPEPVPKAALINGAIYFGSRTILVETKSFISTRTVAFSMPRERSVDIDTVVDWDLAESLIRQTRMVSHGR